MNLFINYKLTLNFLVFCPGIMQCIIKRTLIFFKNFSLAENSQNIMFCKKSHYCKGRMINQI